jgi:replicative DNA helicase
MRLETTILSYLINDEDYARKVVPFLKSEYFTDITERIVYQKIDAFFLKYNSLPAREALIIEIDNDNTLTDDNFSNCGKLIGDLQTNEILDKEWLVDNTEKFCQEKAVYNAIMESIKIIDGKHNSKTSGNIPTILSDALAISFDSHIGHDFLEDYENRYDYYHREEERVAFDLDYFNKITKGGLPRKSLNIILAGTGVGKSLVMCHMAASALAQGQNVLYITLEMAEERIAERIDANLLNIPIADIQDLPRDIYETKIHSLKERIPGKLIIKEYPTASAGVGHFRHLINELKLKRSFEPTIIFVDYLNLAVSARVKPGSNVNTYVYIKAIAEELRGLSVEKNVPILSATQTTRSGHANSDPGLEDTSESFGLPATADFMVALIVNEELDNLGQMMIKQLKNRYNDVNIFKRFIIGVDRSKMKLFDVDQDQQNLMDSGAVMDTTTFGERDAQDIKTTSISKQALQQLVT